MIKSKSKEQSNIRHLAMQQLLYELTQQFQNETFEINQCLRSTIQTVIKQQKQSQENAHTQIIVDELTLFLLSFIKAPGVWAQLLKNDQISSKTTKILINQSQTITNVYKEIIKETNHLLLQNKSKIKGARTSDQESQKEMQKIQPFDFQKMYFQEGTKNLMAELLNQMAKQISDFYLNGKKFIQEQAKRVEDEIKKSEIMNAYFLFGILKQMSTYTYQKVEQNMGLYFKSLPTETIKIFCKYVQKNYEQVELICNNDIPKIFTDEQLQKEIEQKNQYWLNYLKNLEGTDINLKRIQSNKGETAILLTKKQKNESDLQNEDSFTDAQEIIMKIDKQNKIIVTNSKASQKIWEIFDMKDSVSGLYKLMKQQLTDQTQDKIQKQIIAYGIPLGQYANLGGNVGKCLADINKYKSANQFFMDLSKSTIIGGSIGYVLSEIPILSYFVIAGGLTYSFYHTFNNKTTSTKKKFKQLGKTSVTAVGSVGTAVAGMMIGQTLIPVPFLGAFVGGVIGGFLGQTGTNLMTSFMAKESFKNLINYLKDHIIEQSHWKYSPSLLQKLGINQKYFHQELCRHDSKKDAYITSICFCIVTFYQSKRYIARNEQKMKELEEQSKQKQKNQKQLMKQQQVFDNQFNIVAIVDWLTIQHVVLLNQHTKLQNCIKHSVI